MKAITIGFFVIIFFSFSNCKKKVDSDGLPPATQEGKNTLGFLLNGKPWTPQGSRFTSSNLTIDFDAGFNNGIFNIVAYNFTKSPLEQFGLGLRDSLNFLQIPVTLPLSRYSLFSLGYNNGVCDYFNQISNVTSSGSLEISKLDRTNRIIAGTFNATLARANCDTIRITEGRFDMKF